MSNQRYTPEFKDEAVRRVVERGYCVSEVAERLGVSTNSLHKWVKAVKPTRGFTPFPRTVELRSIDLDFVPRVDGASVGYGSARYSRRYRPELLIGTDIAVG